jgi:DNA mismatch repair protein MutH
VGNCIVRAMQNTTPPISKSALLARMQSLAGWTLQQLAAHLAVALPENLQREKGWVGQMIEAYLGGSAGCLPLPDFPHLGIELKTIPVNVAGKPQESTFVCSVPLLTQESCWENSLVHSKLRHVLWVPVEMDKSLPLAQRRIGTPTLWQPNAQQSQWLQQDWQELSEMIGLGELANISSRMGKVLQIRPKAANAKSLCWGIGPEGDKVLTLPRGFYLRASFTQQILQQVYNY